MGASIFLSGILIAITISNKPRLAEIFRPAGAIDNYRITIYKMIDDECANSKHIWREKFDLPEMFFWTVNILKISILQLMMYLQ